MLKKSINSANIDCDSRKRSITLSDFQKRADHRIQGSAEPQIMDLFQHVRLLIQSDYAKADLFLFAFLTKPRPDLYP